MILGLLGLALTLQVTGPAAPAPVPVRAQEPPRSAPVDGVLVIYGKDICPADTICVTAPESERYRIPQILRESETTKSQESFAVRGADLVDNVGRSGTESCSTVGAGGATGCFTQRARAAKKEREAREKAATPILD